MSALATTFFIYIPCRLHYLLLEKKVGNKNSLDEEISPLNKLTCALKCKIY